MWFGFSFMYIRDDQNLPPIDRHELARNVFQWMQEISPWAGAEELAPAVCGLSQNFPNPFNPATTIRYDVAEKGLVTIKVYSVAGQLVKTLVDEVKAAGFHAAVWDGTNNFGAPVASGVYFYRMETAGFSATRKLVMLR